MYKRQVLHLNSQIKGESYIPQGTVIGQIYPNLSEAKNVAITYYVNSVSYTHLSHNTLENYLTTLTDSLLFYSVPRFDVKGRALLQRLSLIHI